MNSTIQYKRPIGPVQSFFKVAPTPQLIDLVIKKYRNLGWNYFVKFKDTNGYGLSAAVVNR